MQVLFNKSKENLRDFNVIKLNYQILEALIKFIDYSVIEMSEQDVYCCPFTVSGHTNFLILLKKKLT